MPAATICKIITHPELEQAIRTGSFAGSTLDQADGFLHFSTEAQVAGTLAAHYAGATDLWLIRVRTQVLGDDLRWEKSRDGSLFPHLYGTLLTRKVDCIEPIDAQP
ncbi:DUF952 domain-containing protein [Neorhodopirellula lusitana]|uniref:DUF952 domain-containing protein n=1 Tax=Neorhodopirellula lusitana TaxID=445327 RepID=UPI00384FFB9E